ncbi:MAG: nucleotidyltransferase domain-containing protein [bacterium]
MTEDKKLKEIIDKIFQVIIPDKIILFGSRARGDAKKDSDYDLLIIKSGIKNERKIAQDIHVNLIGVDESVDIIVKTPENVEKSLNRFMSITKQAIKEGIIVYERPFRMVENS